MKKPADVLLWLYEQDRSKVEVRYRMTGADTAETDVRFGGEKGSWRLLSPLRQYLDFRPSHNAVWDLSRSAWDEIIRWREFERQNAADIVEFERLKAKLLTEEAA